MKNIVINGITYNNVSNVIFNTDTGEQASYKEESEIDNGGSAETVAPLSYFNISAGSIFGFSQEGLNAYENGEITTLIFPKTYSLVQGDSETLYFEDIDSFGMYVEENMNIFPCEVNGIICNTIDELVVHLENETITFPVTVSFASSTIVEGTDFNITYIDGFSHKHKLRKIVIPNTVTSIGYFGYCTQLREIVFEEGIQLESFGGFQNCSSLGTIQLPKINSIPDYAFHNCYSLRSIVIPNTVTSIGNLAFYECYNLIDITFEQGSQCESIGAYAFGYCFRHEPNSTTMTLPSSVNYMDDRVFVGVDRLSSITVEAVNPPTLIGILDTVHLEALYVPAESVDAYKNTTNWSAYADIIQGI